jgi:hypothetical protein
MREIEEEVRGRQPGSARLFPGASRAEEPPCLAQNLAVLE